MIVLTIGLPGSGKTTWAKDLVKSDEKRWKRINRDDLRMMLDGRLWRDDKARESLITRMVVSLLRESIKSGYDVVIDNTNLDSSTRKLIRSIAKEVGNTTVIEKVFNVPLEIVLERNAQRTGEARVPDDVIHALAKRFSLSKKGTFPNIRDKVTEYLQQGPEPIKNDPSLPAAIICDLDGTLAVIHDRDPYDASRCENDLLNQPVADIVKRFFDVGHKVIFISGRSQKHMTPTMNFIKKHLPDVASDSLIFMRQDGDLRHDEIVKSELFDSFVRDRYYINFVLDDRDSVVAAWRKMGLTCLQVNYGNF